MILGTDQMEKLFTNMAFDREDIIHMKKKRKLKVI